jgi:TonB family protein
VTSVVSRRNGVEIGNSGFLVVTVSVSIGIQRLAIKVLSLALLGSAFAVVAATAAAQSDSSSARPATATTPSTPSPAGTVSPSMPSYPDTTKGLENFVKEMLRLEKEGDQQELALYEKSLALPDPDRWFKSVFGEDLGGRMSVTSAPMRASAEIHTAEMLATQLAERRTDVEAVRFDDSCNLRATATEYPFLLLRQTPEHLYDVRFLGTSSVSLWAYFAYVDGGFRFIGNMRKKELGVREVRPPTGSTERIQVGGTVVQAKRIHVERPEYPQGAKALGIQGTVILHAIIAKDGSVQDLYLDEGQCLLTQSAMEAVKKWRYSPTTLNGMPVEVDTTIQVIFALGR